MKKILFIITQSEIGGAQRYVYEAATHLDPQKYEVLVAAGQGDGELFQKLKLTQVQPLCLRRMRRTPWPWQIFLSIREIFNLLKKEKPNILFLCSTTAGFLGSIAAFFYRGSSSKSLKYRKVEPRVIYRIGGWAFCDPRNFILNKFILLAEKLTAPLKDKIIVNSEIDKKLAVKYRIAKSEKIIKIHNGLDLNALNFLSREEAQKSLYSKSGLEQFLVVGTVANFYKAKGLEYLIEAFTRPGLVTGPGLVIIGEGRLRPRLEALIKKHNLQDKIILAGRMPDAYKYLKAFDIFVLPSLKEGFPWVILEAMAAQLPLIATKVGALPEIIENEVDGLLIEPKNSRELAEKIALLLKNPELRENLAIRAKEKVGQNFSLEKMLKETEKLFSGQ